MKRFLCVALVGVCGFWLDAAEAAEQAAPAVAAVAAPASSASVTGQLTQLVLGLLLVLGLIFFLAWLLRRVQSAVPGGRQAIEILGTRAVGPRDRLLLVQVGKEQILIGHTPGNLTVLHVMNEPVEVSTPTRQAQPEFAQRLMELLGKDQKDKS